MTCRIGPVDDVDGLWRSCGVQILVVGWSLYVSWMCFVALLRLHLPTY